MMEQPTLFDQQPQGIPLSKFNARITDAVNMQPELQRQWVIAETSDVRVSRGHCYMELVERNPDTDATVAKIGAVIWASNFARLSAMFFQATGSRFATGIKVMVNVSANFHEQYGIKAIVHDINPEFTLGDMARQRKEIIDRLTREGIIDNNKQLGFPTVPQRVAVISAEGAAGYGDFINQLHGNAQGLVFYTCLFTAAMQGTNTVPTVLSALECIREHINLFDVVVIIRGGGSTTDLNAFDNYQLAATIAQFPIPVIVGIGHERDITVLDYVAAMRVKTPTAAAQWLIEQGTNALAHLDELTNTVVSTARESMSREREHLAYFQSLIPAIVQRLLDTSRLRLDQYTKTIPLILTARLAAERSCLDTVVQRMVTMREQTMLREQMHLQALDDKVTLLSPRNILNRGYALVKTGGTYITDADAQLQPGAMVTIHFRHGLAHATITDTKQ